ncbi:hypothetical protein AAFN60_14685 [Roseibacillus persicicus]|uniref:beta strand repeat-containing protein n=1 Tax=Roseibacillus persicicus TaxID=454148 RepID=UPI00398B2C4E
MKFKQLFSPRSAFLLCLAANLPTTICAQVFTWDGGGTDTNWSTNANWLGDIEIPPTGVSVIFDGSVGLANTNDTDPGIPGAAWVSALDLDATPAITFEPGAGSFVLGGTEAVTIGLAGNSTVVLQKSPNPQEIIFPITLKGGNKSRIIEHAAGAGSVTFSGDINFTNDRMLTDGAAGTVILTGNNTGVGLNAPTAGTNALRSTFILNVEGGHLELGSPGCLGDFSMNSANLRGFNMQGNGATFSTSPGLDLVGPDMIDKVVTYHQTTNFSGDGDLELGGIMNTAASGRGFGVIGDGDLLISGTGLFLTHREEAQTVVLQPQNAGRLILNAPIIDTFNSNGITTPLTGLTGTPADSSLRMNGTGVLEINADSAATFNGDFRAFNGTTILGHANALGSNGMTSLIDGPLTIPADLFVGSAELDVADVSGIEVGMAVTGTDIPAGATVIAVNTNFDPPRVELSATPTATTDTTGVSVSFSNLDVTTSVDMFVGDVLLDVADVTGIETGMAVSGPNIADGTTVITIDTSFSPPRVELSFAPTVASDTTGVSVAFSGRTIVVPLGVTEIRAGATIDLNGFVIDETIKDIAGGGAGPASLVNNNTSTPGGITTDIFNTGNPTFGGAGDIEIQNVYHPATVGRTMTKEGTGTLTLSGSLNNTRYGLIVNEGNVNLNKSDGAAVANNPLVVNHAASVVKITGTSSGQIQGSGSVQLNTGIFDLNGSDQSFGILETATSTEPGGTVTNSSATPATLTIGGGSAAGTFTFPGVISDGAGILNLQQGDAASTGATVQVLTGANTYTGNTTIHDGTLSLATPFLADSSSVIIDNTLSANAANLELTHGVGDTVDKLFIDGVQVAAGTYGSTSSGAANQDDTHFSGTGHLIVTSDPVDGGDYDTWAVGFGLTGGASDDDDNDGLSNFEEYAFGLEPNNASSLNPIEMVLDRSSGTFSYTRRDPALGTELSYSVYTSTTLEADDWTLDAGATQTAGVTDGNGNQTVAVTLATLPTEEKLFVRIQASSPTN